MKKYQTFWKRLAASIIDSLLFFPYIFLYSTNLYFYYSIELSYILIVTGYTVYFHGKYGQTLGKRIIGIKVLDIDEALLIGFKRAFFREAVWFFLSIIVLTVSFFQSGGQQQASIDVMSYYSFILSMLPFVWVIVELITMLLNEKRRALHDFIARSVVVDVAHTTSYTEQLS